MCCCKACSSNHPVVVTIILFEHLSSSCLYPPAHTDTGRRNKTNMLLLLSFSSRMNLDWRAEQRMTGAQQRCNWAFYFEVNVTHSSVTLRGRPLGRAWRCLLLQRTTVSMHVHWPGHWGPGAQLLSSSTEPEQTNMRTRITFMVHYGVPAQREKKRYFFTSVSEKFS